MTIHPLASQLVFHVSIVLASILIPSIARAQTELAIGQVLSPEQLLADFTQGWDESKWEQTFRGAKYMRAVSDDGWKLRMTTLQSLVAQGKKSIPALEKSLTSEHTPTRILAAQTIGYLAPDANLELLERVAETDSDAAARLYAVDAIGMSGKGPQVDWAKLDKEKNRDVLKHISYARQREASAVEAAVVQDVAEYNAVEMDSAKVGQPAPDFALKTVDGKQFQLSQFRGKQPVVLVFIYGDT